MTWWALANMTRALTAAPGAWWWGSASALPGRTRLRLRRWARVLMMTPRMLRMRVGVSESCYCYSYCYCYCYCDARCGQHVRRRRRCCCWRAAVCSTCCCGCDCANSHPRPTHPHRRRSYRTALCCSCGCHYCAAVRRHCVSVVSVCVVAAYCDV